MHNFEPVYVNVYINEEGVPVIGAWSTEPVEGPGYSRTFVLDASVRYRKEPCGENAFELVPIRIPKVHGQGIGMLRPMSPQQYRERTDSANQALRDLEDAKSRLPRQRYTYDEVVAKPMSDDLKKAIEEMTSKTTLVFESKDLPEYPALGTPQIGVIVPNGVIDEMVDDGQGGMRYKTIAEKAAEAISSPSDLAKALEQLRGHGSSIDPTEPGGSFDASI